MTELGQVTFGGRNAQARSIGTGRSGRVHSRLDAVRPGRQSNFGLLAARLPTT
jgi:hypothetical protein